MSQSKPSVPPEFEVEVGQQQQFHSAEDAQDVSNERGTNDKENNENGALAKCRLRHGLNDHCLCNIFDLLDVNDLIQLCELDTHYQNLITNWVSGKKLINFCDINFNRTQISWTPDKMFEVFGKTMRKIKYDDLSSLGTFQQFLQFVIQHCELGVLTEIELTSSRWPATSATMEKAMPFFANLRKLTLTGECSRENNALNHFLSRISLVATNLTHLTLNTVQVSDNVRLAVGASVMRNLKELRLNFRGEHNHMTELCEFLRTKSKLELFSYTGCNDIDPVARTLIEYCPRLNAFWDCQLRNPYRDNGNTISEPMKQRYNYLCRFKNLKNIYLTSYTQCGSDLYCPLMQMASNIEMAAKIEKFTFYIDCADAIVLPAPVHCEGKAFDRFTSLTVVEVQVCYKYNDNGMLDLSDGFIGELLSTLPTIQKLILRSIYVKPRDLCKIIDAIPNINELDISENTILHLPAEIRNIVKSIRKRRVCQMAESHQPQKPFHMVVNKMQWRELQVYKDIDKILTTRVVKGKLNLTRFNDI